MAAEYIGLQAHLGRGLDVIRARPFNHVGPGQAETFVVSGLAKRIAEAERDGIDEIRAGNLGGGATSPTCATSSSPTGSWSRKGAPGVAYNVCSGVPVTIASLLERTARACRAPDHTAQIDAPLFRPTDVPVLVGDCTLAHALTGWAPEIPRAVTIVDVLEDWRKRLRA